MSLADLVTGPLRAVFSHRVSVGYGRAHSLIHRQSLNLMRLLSGSQWRDFMSGLGSER